MGYVNVDNMLAEIPLTLFNEWADYAELEPFGEERADLRSAIVSCVMANAWRGKSGRTFKPGDFMPQFGETIARQTTGELKHALHSYAEAHNARLRTKRSNA